MNPWIRCDEVSGYMYAKLLEGLLEDAKASGLWDKCVGQERAASGFPQGGVRAFPAGLRRPPGQVRAPPWRVRAPLGKSQGVPTAWLGHPQDQVRAWGASTDQTLGSVVGACYARDAPVAEDATHAHR